MKTTLFFKFVIAIFVFFSGFTTNVFAQPGYGKGGPHYGGFGPCGPDSCHVKLMVDDLADAISLTESQKTKVYEIHWAHIEEVKKISQTNSGECTVQQTARLNSRQNMDEKIKALLSADQQIKYDAYMKGRRGPNCKARCNC